MDTVFPSSPEWPALDCRSRWQPGRDQVVDGSEQPGPETGIRTTGSSVGAVVDQKYRATRTGLRATSTGSALLPSSVLAAERVAAFYGRALPQHARGSLADLGCGTSPLRSYYEPLVDHAWSLDWPGSMHDVQLDAFADLTGGVPFRSESLDTVIASDVLEHLREPADFLVECHRLLRPGGVLLGNVPFLYWLHEEPHDYYRYTEHGLRYLLAGAGFSTVEVHVLGGGVDVLVDISGKILARLSPIGRPLARMLQSAWVSLTSVGAVRRRLSGIERKLPLSYGFVAIRTS